ncbi:MAG: hypothetical protein AAFY41_14660, partial [Bacteroidota bacterium]
MIRPIEDIVHDAEKSYLSFSPNSASVKPVHIANGFFRQITGLTYSTRLLHKFVFSETKKGAVPRGHELDTLYSELSELQRIDGRDIEPNDLPKFRRLMKSVVNADSGVYTGTMQSYTHGFSSFITTDSIAQDGGELIATCLKLEDSSLVRFIRKTLENENDIVTKLCKPLLIASNDSDSRSIVPDGQEPMFFSSDVLAHGKNPSQTGKLWLGILQSSNTLSHHLESHPNKLYGLRLAVIFTCFTIIRHLTCAEAYYVPDAHDRIPPFLLDFSDTANNPIAQASTQTYLRSSQSLARFYGWVEACAIGLLAVSEKSKRKGGIRSW